MHLEIIRPSIFIVILISRFARAGNYSSLTDAFPQLVNLTRNSASTHLGKRNTTHGCLLAVNESFVIQNGNLALSEHTFLDPSFTINDFVEASKNGQFPCGATFDGNLTGAPVLEVPYPWCTANCGGWGLSIFSTPREWIGPMVGFILPCLVFCLSIPRRRKLLVGSMWFIAEPNHTFAFFTTPLRATAAAILVSIDTLIWLCICFAAAGPMILSGIYEAFLDSRILSVLEKSLDSGSLTMQMRARLLLIILVGNFDMTDSGDDLKTKEGRKKGNCNEVNQATEHTNRPSSTMSGVQINQLELPQTAPSRRTSSQGEGSSTTGVKSSTVRVSVNGTLVESTYIPVGEECLTTWCDVEKIIHKLGSNPQDECSRTIQGIQEIAREERIQIQQRFAAEREEIGKSNTNQDERAAAITASKSAQDREMTDIEKRLHLRLTAAGSALADSVNKQDRAVGKVKTRLRTMLATQYSFGSTIGAPVVFFAGSFVYSLVDTLSVLGNNDTAHALAFGMWWMTIPHVAIVAGLLLGANNPNTLEGIVGKPFSEGKPYLGIFELSYLSSYKTEWMWFRGRSKRQWVEKVLSTECRKNKLGLGELRAKTRFTLRIWISIIGLSLFLIAVPFILAFTVSYYTPRIGLSCRSLTFLVYFLLQLCQILLWVWILTCSETDTEGCLHSPTILTERTWTSRNGKKHHPRWLNKSAWILWWFLAIIFGLGSVFTAIGGTMMQIMGVYGNCLCALPIQYWRNPTVPDAYLYMGSNSGNDIRAADTFWVNTGITAVVFLCVTCYAGWWYQRMLRYTFRDIAENLEGYSRAGGEK